MTTEILIAGFGGQGVLSLGKILAYAAVQEGREVTWLPSYGPEQRGGTSNVSVVISDERISSPIVDTYDVVIALNQQSLSKFEPRIKPHGMLLYDSYGIVEKPHRHDVDVYEMTASQTARDKGVAKMLNMVVAGALISAKPIVSKRSIISALRSVLPARYQSLIGENEKAIEAGAKAIKLEC